jgi:UDP-N-acetylglucosamine--N-acetylmuramyl-(pentapeptide) pyrophosphoryl-undecaprenol N-acetylglucosamine transferase
VYAAAGLAVEAHPFLDNMAQSFADADLVVCRSGASTVAEIAASGKCALFVPFPGAADDHQLRNAELLEKAGAALLVPESELSAERFMDEVTALLKSPQRMAEMGAKARSLAHPDAAAHIAAMAISAAKEFAARKSSAHKS